MRSGGDAVVDVEGSIQHRPVERAKAFTRESADMTRHRFPLSHGIVGASRPFTECDIEQSRCPVSVIKLVRLWALLLFLMAVGHAVAADSKVALVAGVSNYRHAPVLQNPVNDAAKIGTALGRLGFNVISTENPDFEMLRRALLDFSELASRAEMAVVFVSGYALRADGDMWFLPGDADIRLDVDVHQQAIALQAIAIAANRASQLGLVMLDACRSSPFHDRLQGGPQSSTVASSSKPTIRESKSGRGVGRPDAEPKETRSGALIAQACREGSTSPHEHGTSSPFAAAILGLITTEGLEVGQLFRNVREEVLVATNREQEPFTYGSLPSKVIFLRTHGMPLAPVPATRPRASISPDRPLQPLSLLEEASLKVGDSFSECPTCPRMIVIPSGQFLMGSPPTEAARNVDEGPATKVVIPKPLAVGMYEVTLAQYDAFVRATGHRMQPGCRIWDHRINLWDNRTAYTYRTVGFTQDETHPVVCVDWTDAKAFVAWLRKMTGKAYRLLSEAEWEYAARAGTTTPFSWGSTASLDLANYDGTSTYGPNGKKGTWRLKTMPVGSFKPNPWGLYDMHGNVWEWVEDCYSREDYKYLQPAIRQTGSAWTGACEPDGHAFRGGSWVDDADYLRSARRVEARPGGRYNYLGLRVARTIDR
jgi:formylglycine-generating enzyme required for sulfatase activity